MSGQSLRTSFDRFGLLPRKTRSHASAELQNVKENWPVAVNGANALKAPKQTLRPITTLQEQGNMYSEMVANTHDLTI